MKPIILGLLALAFTGCTTGDRASEIELGMTPEQVIGVLGRPDGQSMQGSQLGYQYTNRLISGWSWDRADYVAIFTDGHLMSWGPGQVRPGSGPSFGTLVVVPLQ